MAGWRGATHESGHAQSWTSILSAIDPASESVGLTVLSPDEALRSTKYAPSDSELVIDGLTDAEWDAFEAALAEN